MQNRTTQAHWLTFFPTLNAIKNPAWSKLLENVKNMNFTPGELLFRNGEACQYYILVLSGTVRVKKTSLDGHELTLYRLQTGDACELTTTCLLANDYYRAEAIAETAVSAIVIPKVIFQEAISCSPEFSQLVYKDVEKGMSILLNLLEDVAFGPVDVRLAKCLLTHRNSANEVNATHCEIAANLGTAREVVSRTLKRFEKYAWVKLHRGKISILDEKALQHIVDKAV